MALACSSPTDERGILETPLSWAHGQERRRLLEAAEKTVSRSILCLGFVVSQSVMPVEQLCLSRSRMRCREDLRLCMCGSVCVVFLIVIIIFCNVCKLRCSICFILNSHHHQLQTVSFTAKYSL